MPRTAGRLTFLTLAAAALLAGAPAAQSAGPRTQAAQATKRVLARAGLTSLVIHCARRGPAQLCRWSGSRSGFRQCEGRSLVRPRGRGRARRLVVRISTTRCWRVRIGFNENPAPRFFALQHRLAAPVARIAVPWKQVETLPGAFYWGDADRQYQSALDNGLQPIIVALAAPCWARPGLTCGGTTYGPPATAYDRYWVRYVAALATRYPRAAGIEVWNEPNFLPAFDPKVDPNRYVELLREAYDAIKAVNRLMPVVAGGLFAGDQSGDFGMADGEFVARMYASGAAGHLDALALHPYPISVQPARWDAAVLDRAMARVRAAKRAAGDAGRPIWITELGASTTTGPGFPPALTPAAQSSLLMGILRGFARAGDVPVALIHRLIDPPHNGGLGAATDVSTPFGVSVYYPIEEGFGAYRSDASPKPLACALSRELGGSLRC